MTLRSAGRLVAAIAAPSAATLDKVSALFAMAMLAAAAGTWMAEQNVVDAETRATSRAGAGPAVADASRPQTMIAGYLVSMSVTPTACRYFLSRKQILMARAFVDSRNFFCDLRIDRIELALTMPKGKKSFNRDLYGTEERETLTDFVNAIQKNA